jgi:hypothetical protein
VSYHITIRLRPPCLASGFGNPVKVMGAVTAIHLPRQLYRLFLLNKRKSPACRKKYLMAGIRAVFDIKVV